MKNNLQKGFGIVEIIFVALAIILVGFLGWKLYEAQKMLDDASKTDTFKTSTIKKPETDNLTETATFDAGRKVTLKYPSDWKLENREDDLRGEAIVSPTQDIFVVVVAKTEPLSGMGGYCDPADSATISVFNKYDIKAHPEYKLIETKDSDNIAGVYTAKTSDIKDIKAGDSVCDLGYLDLFLNDSKGHLSISIVDNDNKNLLNNSNFATARKIVQTLEVE